MPVRQEFAVSGLAPPISHYCDAVRFGDLLFSGQADEVRHVALM